MSFTLWDQLTHRFSHEDAIAHHCFSVIGCQVTWLMSTVRWFMYFAYDTSLWVMRFVRITHFEVPDRFYKFISENNTQRQGLPRPLTHLAQITSIVNQDARVFWNCILILLHLSCHILTLSWHGNYAFCAMTGPSPLLFRTEHLSFSVGAPGQRLIIRPFIYITTYPGVFCAEVRSLSSALGLCSFWCPISESQILSSLVLVWPSLAFYLQTLPAGPLLSWYHPLYVVCVLIIAWSDLFYLYVPT